MTIDDRPEDQHKTEDLTESAEGGTDMQPGDSGGEDEGSAPIEGKDGHLKDDQKAITK